MLERSILENHCVLILSLHPRFYLQYVLTVVVLLLFPQFQHVILVGQVDFESRWEFVERVVIVVLGALHLVKHAREACLGITVSLDVWTEVVRVGMSPAVMASVSALEEDVVVTTAVEAPRARLP